MEYKVGGMLQTLQDVNKIPQITKDIETLYSIIRKKSEEINDLQSGLFLQFYYLNQLWLN